ncbi:MAG TPA: histidinol dehydrogenase [Gemmataceae bacterium]|nr:histidinol dehydrogenase [Gemmataceae bacterium]
MDNVKMRCIRCAEPGAARQLVELRQQLALQADIVSPKGRKLTEAVFGEALPSSRVVERICADVQSRGLEAVLHYTEKLDGVKLDRQTLRVDVKDLAKAHASAEPAFLETLRRVRHNVLRFQLGLVHGDAVLTVPGSHELRLRYRPMKRVGVCVPGGAAAYPSTLLMTVVPAQAAGVKKIAVVMPPTANGANNRDLLATCWELGVREVYRIGGAQAVAALAWGVDGLPSVDMIVGPGNIFVTLAKKHVFGQVAIDCLAGPSEIVVLADKTANAEFVAADLLAQAEHDPATSILITWHEPLIAEVQAALNQQVAKLSRGAAAKSSLERFGAMVLARSAVEAIELTNAIGPEHLHIETDDPEKIAAKIDNAGAIFLGHYSPVALGDYAAGPSHVLPTGGTARFASGLTANDFLRRSSVLQYTRPGMEKLAADVRMLAAKEGLTGHAASVELRLSAEAPAENKTRQSERGNVKRQPLQQSP